MTMLASMTDRPSHTYGRHHRSRANSRMIQAPHAAVENASARPMAGEPNSSSSDALVPAQYSMANSIAMNTIALPRSGWSTTRADGEPDQQLVPDRGDERGHVGLPGGVQRGQPIGGERDDYAGERSIDFAESGSHRSYPCG